MDAPVAWLLIVAGAGSLTLALLLTPLAARVARRTGYVDLPGGHKSHAAPTPYGGGPALFLAFWLPAAGALLGAALVPQGAIAEVFGESVRAYVGGLMERSTGAAAVLAGALVLHLLGLYDDLRPQGPGVKLAVMLAVALATALVPGLRIASHLEPVASIALTVLWIVIVTNTFNFLDNMDGLSAGVAAICLGFLIVCGLWAGQVLVPVLASLFLGAVLGFLVFNVPPARVFMGDAGSLVIGYMLSVASILTTYYESGAGRPPFPLAIPLAILAVPLYDFASVVLIRLRERRNPLRGDQRHFSHRLVARGLDRVSAVLTIYLATATTGLAATLLPRADLRETITVAAIVLMVLSIVAILETPARKST